MVRDSHLLQLQRTAPQFLSQSVLIADYLENIVVLLSCLGDLPLHSQRVAVQHFQPPLMVHLDHVVI